MSFGDSLQNSLDNFNSEREKFLNRVANKLLGKVKMRTPVGKINGGTLRRSWQLKKISDAEREIINNVYYGQYLEFGHRTRGGKGFVKGRYMLTKSVEEIEREFESDLNIFMDNLWK